MMSAFTLPPNNELPTVDSGRQLSDFINGQSNAVYMHLPQQ